MLFHLDSSVFAGEEQRETGKTMSCPSRFTFIIIIIVIVVIIIIIIIIIIIFIFI